LKPRTKVQFYFRVIEKIHPPLVSLLWTDKTELKGAEKSNPFGLINLDSVEELMTETLESIKKLQAYVKDVNVNISISQFNKFILFIRLAKKREALKLVKPSKSC